MAKTCDNVTVERVGGKCGGRVLNFKKWIAIDRIVSVLNSDWQWAKNVRCKYITLRIDMRDGHCLIKDRKGNDITIQDLEYQYGEANTRASD